MQPPEPLRETRADVHFLNELALSVAGGLASALVIYGVLRSGGAALIGAPLGAYGTWKLHDRIGHAFGGLFFASGHTTPHPAEYSRARSLAVQGYIDAAVQAYQEASAEDPGDPQPYVEIARLERDARQRPQEALAWLRRARGAQRLTPVQDALIVRELAELCEFRLREPLRASPELAQLARSQAGTPAGEWARATLERIRAESARELRGESSIQSESEVRGEPPTEPEPDLRGEPRTKAESRP